MGTSRFLLGVLLCIVGVLPVGVRAATAQLVGQFFTLEYDAGPTLYSQPSIGGDAVKFLPAEFFATVVGTGPGTGQNSDLAAESITFTLTAKEGYGFTNFVWTALGDYSRLLFGSDTTDTDVGVFGQMMIKDATDPAAVSLMAPMLASDLSLLGNNKAWNAAASISNGASLSNGTLISNQAQAASNPLTKVAVTIFEQLDASVQDLGMQAKIQMKLGKLQVAVEQLPANVVPLPPSVLLFGSAIAAVAGLSRRRRRSTTA